MNEGEDRRLPEPAKPTEPRTGDRAALPPADLHDPFSHFEFEPTDGGDF